MILRKKKLFNKYILYKYFPITDDNCYVRKINRNNKPYIIFNPVINPKKMVKDFLIKKKWELCASGKIFMTNPLYFNDPFDSMLIENNDKKPTKEQRYKIIKRLEKVITYRYYKNLSDQAIYELVKSSNFDESTKRIVNMLGIDTDHKFTNIMKSIRSSIDVYRDEISITCFTEKNDNALMWANYANSYNGFCIEYDFSKMPKEYKHALNKVTYTNKKFQINKIRSLHDSINILLTKTKQWKYEKEWRLIIQITYKEINDKTYGCLDLSKYIRTIYLGYKMSEENKNKIINKYKNTDVAIKKMLLDKENRKILFEQL